MTGRVVFSRLLTATTHAIQVEKPKHFAFRATPFTVLQLLTEAGVDVRPISLATGLNASFESNWADFGYEGVISSERRTRSRGPHFYYRLG